MSIHLNLGKFVNSENIVDLKALEKAPKKLLKFFRILKQDPKICNAFQQKNPSINLQAIQNQLLAPVTLSHYHFIKLMGYCPELVEQNADELNNHITGFLRDLNANPNDLQMLTRACKVSEILSNSVILQNTPHKTAFFQYVRTSDPDPNQTCFLIPRHLWALHVPSWRPMLTGKFVKEEQVIEMTSKMLLTIREFLKSGSLPPMSCTELLAYFDKATELNCQSLQNDCLDALASFVNEENVADFLELGINGQNSNLIQSCIEYINSQKCGLEMHWNPERQLKIHLHQLSSESGFLLDKFSSHTQRIVFQDEVVAQYFIKKQKVFPEVTGFELVSDIKDKKVLNRLGALLPNTRTCVMPTALYNKLLPEDVRNVSKIEILRLNDVAECDLQKKIFAHLKVRMIQSRGTGISSFKVSEDSKDEPFSLLIPTNLFNASLSLRGSPKELRDQMTDEILLELLDAYPAAKGVNFTLCTKFSEKTMRALSGSKQVSYLNFDGCTQMTDAMIAALGRSSKKYDYISFVGCTEITDQSLNTLGNHLNLDTNNLVIDLAGCDKLTDKAILRFIKKGGLRKWTVSEKRRGLPKAHAREILEIPISESKPRLTGFFML